MAALVRNKPRTYSSTAARSSAPLASATRVYEGEAIGFDESTGSARSLIEGDLFLGFATQAASSIGAAAGSAAVHVPLAAAGEVDLPVAGVTAANIGSPVYVTDGDGFATSGLSLLGWIMRVPESGVAVVRFEARMLPRRAGTWAQMQGHAAHDGEQWLLTDTVLRPEWWQYSVSASRWYPLSGRSRLVNLVGSVATPLASITGVTAPTFFSLADMALPAGFLAVGSRLSLNAYFQRIGANATGLIRARLGTGADTNDAILAVRTMNATDGQTFWMDLQAVVTASDALLSTQTSVANNVATEGIADVSGQVDITAPMRVTLGTLSTDAADAFHCLAVAVDVEF